MLGRRGAILLVIFANIFISCLVSDYASGQVQYPEQEIRVHDLPRPTARSPQSSDVLRASLEIVFHNKEICCGKDSALDDALQYADPQSLKDIADKLQGRHLLSDGRPIMVSVELVAPDRVNALYLIGKILDQRAALLEWNSHLFVFYGMTYTPIGDTKGGLIMDVTHKFFLQDARFSGSRREVTFDRLTEDASQVQGLLFVDWKPQ